MMTAVRSLRHGRRALDALASHGRNDWFRIANQTDAPGPVDVWIYDEIGYFGTPAADFIDRIRDITAPINLHINSLGGDVFDGIAIYNALRTHTSHITTTVDSMAASIASVIAQAGDDRIMVTHSQMMIHEAWGIAVGGADDMRSYADTLDMQSNIIADIYADRSGRPAARFRDLMAAETWMTHDETVNHGLADRILTPETKDTEADSSEPAPAAALAAEINWSAIVAGQTDEEILL